MAVAAMVAYMEVHMVADMEVHMVADIVLVCFNGIVRGDYVISL